MSQVRKFVTEERMSEEFKLSRENFSRAARMIPCQMPTLYRRSIIPNNMFMVLATKHYYCATQLLLWRHPLYHGRRDTRMYSPPQACRQAGGAHERPDGLLDDAHGLERARVAGHPGHLQAHPLLGG